MEEENEVLDWGNEEDEHHQENAHFQEDADDAVSLGDEDDEQAFYAQQFAENANGDLPCAKCGDGDDIDRSGSREMSVDLSQFQQQDPQTSSLTDSHISNQKESPKRSQTRIQPRLTHALPPKPVASTMPYMPPSHTSIVEATAMSARTREHKRSTSEKGSHYKEPLPTDWEIRYSRGGSRNLYYYNVVTHQSTWYHPASPTSTRGKVASNSSKLPPSSSSYGSSALTYEDRHYRPGSPDTRHDDGVKDGSDSRPTEHGSTPPKSPRPRGRARSASPSPVIQRQPSTEFRDKNQLNHSRRSADTKEDFSDVARNRNVPVVDSSTFRRATSSKAHNDTSGHTNRENRHVHSSVGVTEHAESTIENGAMLPRSYSTRGRNCEREPAPSSADSRQELNQTQSLPASRHRSPPPSYHDREWIPAQREQRGPDSAQQLSAFSTKVESIPRAGHTSVPRRDRPSRFDQPLAISTQPAPLPIVTGPAVATERPPRPHDRDVYLPDDANASYSRSAERHTERDVYPSVGNARVYSDDRSTQTYADYRPDRQRALPVDPEYAPLASDQQGPSSRRKRVPLPPQAASFREETFRKRDHEPPRPTGTRPPHPHNSLPFPSGPKEPQRPSISGSSVPPHGPRQSVPPVRADSDVVHRRRRSVSDHRYTDNMGRERTLSTEYSGSGSGYSQTQAHTPTEMPMDVDVDNLPSSSSRVPPAPPLDINNDAVSRPLSGRSVSTAESVPPPPTSNFAAHPGNDFKRREAARVLTEQQSSLSRQDFIPRNQRVIYDGTDRHVPRRETRNHPSDFNRPGSSGFAPRLTGPNSVPIGNRRPMVSSQDTGPRLPEAAPPPHGSPLRNLKPLPPLPPGKESYERPVYDVKAAVDSYRVAQQENAGSNQYDHSPSSYKRDYPFEPTSPAIANSKDAHRDFHHHERSRFDQPLREARVPQSYERPPPEPQPRAPPHEAISGKDVLVRDYQPPKAIESYESPQSPHAKLLVAKEKLERLVVAEERLRKQDHQRQQPVDDSNPPKAVPARLPPQGLQDKGVADDRLRNTRFQEQQGQRSDDYRSPRLPSPHRLPKKPSLARENVHQSASQRRPGLPDLQLGYPRPMGERSHEPAERLHKHEGRFDIPQKHGPTVPPPQHVAPVDRDLPHGQRRPERPRPADALLLNAPPPAERRTRWGDPLQATATSEAAERPDGRGGRSSQIDRNESEASDGFSGGSHRQHRLPALPRRSKDDSHLGEPDLKLISRAKDAPLVPPPAREHEKAVPNARRLLDRLSLDPNAPFPSKDQSLWDRVQIPEKRDRHEMDYIMGSSYEADVMGPGASEPAMKRARRRSSKLKRPRRGGAP